MGRQHLGGLGQLVDETVDRGELVAHEIAGVLPAEQVRELLTGWAETIWDTGIQFGTLGAFRHGIIGVFWKTLECRIKLCIKIRTHYPQ